MFRNLSRNAGGRARGAPLSWRTGSLLALSVLALLVEGCCGVDTCDSCGNTGPLRRMSQRIIAPFRNGGCSSCGRGGGGEVFLGPPPVVEGIETAPPSVLSAPPTVIEPGPAPSATPMTEPAPLELNPVEPGVGPTSSRSPAGTTTSRQARKPPASVSTDRRDAGRSPAADPLASYSAPRLEAPSDSAVSDVSTAAIPPAADHVTLPGPEPGPTASPPIGETTNSSNTNPTPTAGGQVSLAPGFRSFVNVAPRLAGGSLPTDSGWNWLAQQGFHTVLDLRPSDEVRHQDLAAINASGLRYIALPVETDTIDDPKTLARFASEITQEPAQPLYFFDTNGARASVLWFLHDVTHNDNAPDAAAQKADEFGPRNPALWTKARAYLDRLNPPATSPGTSQSIDPPSGPVPDLEVTPPSLKATARDLAHRAVHFVASRWNQAPSQAEPKPEPPAPRDLTSWRPFAALAAAGLTVPLAFLGRSALGLVGNRVAASLPAPRSTPKSLPSASDV